MIVFLASQTPPLTLPETNIAIENPPVWWYLQGNIGIFMGYVSFREGKGNQGLIFIGQGRISERGTLGRLTSHEQSFTNSTSSPIDTISFYYLEINQNIL